VSLSVEPLVSIVTPTFPARQNVLLDRCVPSVGRADWPEVEHIIVSDPNPALPGLLENHPGPHAEIRLAQIGDIWRDGVQDRSTGAVPWAVGSLMALGEYVGFLGDDDEMGEHHIRRHVEALQTTGADFTVSVIEFRVRGQHYRNIGTSFNHGDLDSIGIMCRRSALRTMNWSANGQDAADYRLVRDWLARGLRGHLLGGEPTSVHNDGWAAR
jgi:hypothetical protein